MDLILTQDIDNLGFKDDIVSVKNGYGRNFLIPYRGALLATTSQRKVLSETLKQRAFKEAKEIEAAKAVAKEIKALEIKIFAKSGVGNKLFGSINNTDVANFLSKNKITIEKKFIQILGGNIKTLGKHTAKVRLHRAVSVSLDFEVVAEN